MALEEFLKIHNGKKLLTSDIEMFEKEFGFKLPERMKQLYVYQNGGYLEKCGSDELDLPLRKIYPIIKSFDERITTVDDLLSNQKEDNIIPMVYVPFCSDESGENYYIRIDDQGYGEVYYIFSEFIDDFLDNPKDSCIANSFEEFSDIIRRWEDD